MNPEAAAVVTAIQTLAGEVAILKDVVRQLANEIGAMGLNIETLAQIARAQHEDHRAGRK